MAISVKTNSSGINVNVTKGATQADLTNSVNNSKTYRDEAQAFSIVSEDKSIESAYSALNASISSTTASDKATIATTKANEASNSANSASASETVCIAKATITTDKANIATAQSVIATDKANEASVSANTATTQAGIATTKASEASTSASNALASENNADTSEANALIYRNQAESFANSINPSDLVHISGTETITGNKTFSGTVSGLTKATVGLSNVDNTSDANKPISTATQTALNTKVDKVTSTDNAVVRFDGTTGKLQNSGVIIDDNGNVGIGTDSPIAKLTMYSDSGNLFSRSQSGTSTLLTGVYSDGTTCVNSLGNYPLILLTNNVERMRIDTAGNVGIGDSTPQYKLSIGQSISLPSTAGSKITAFSKYTDVGNASFLRFDTVRTSAGSSHTSSEERIRKVVDVTEMGYIGFGENNVKLGNGSGDKVIIDANGNVGIGTTPSAWGSSWRSLDLLSSSITSYTTLTDPYTIISNNAYISGSSSTLSSVYKNNGSAQSYNQGGGSHLWRTAPSGTVGNAITWTNVMTLDPSGNLLLTSGTGGLGYGTGAGGTVTQLTSKSTAVTLNKPSGQITMNSAALAAGARVEFILYSSLISDKDTISIAITGGTGEPRNYRVEHVNSVIGAAYIRLSNLYSGSLSEAIGIQYNIIKGATA